MKRKIAFSILVVFLIAVGIFTEWRWVGPGHCRVCDRKECKALLFGLENRWGYPIKTCCPRCGLQYKKFHPGSEVVFATDFSTGKRINPKTAFYVEGSDVVLCHRPEAIRNEPGCCVYTGFDRCLPSVIAFEKESEAKVFQEKHGGHIVRWNDLKSEIVKKE